MGLAGSLRLSRPCRRSRGPIQGRLSTSRTRRARSRSGRGSFASSPARHDRPPTSIRIDSSQNELLRYWQVSEATARRLLGILYDIDRQRNARRSVLSVVCRSLNDRTRTRPRLLQTVRSRGQSVAQLLLEFRRQRGRNDLRVIATKLCNKGIAIRNVTQQQQR